MIDPPDAMPSQADRRPPRMRSRWDLVGLIPMALAIFALVSVVVPLSFGPFSILLVLEEQAFVAVLVLLVPLALLTRARGVALGMVAAAIVAAVLFGSEWVSLPGSGGGRSDLSAMTWNLQYGQRTPAEAVAQLQNVTTDVIALEEMEPHTAAAIEADAMLTARYPYRLMAPRPLAWGIGLLSRYPISETRSLYPPACVEALLTTPRGPVRVIVGHPIHADISLIPEVRIPYAYNSTDRDTGIKVIRQLIDESLSSGERLLVLGDFNTTASEPEYKVLTGGLRDTQVEVGSGPGWTWRPSRFAFLPIGFIRIDLQLTGGAIRPTSTTVDCSLPGDHCRLFGSYEID